MIEFRDDFVLYFLFIMGIDELTNYYDIKLTKYNTLLLAYPLWLKFYLSCYFSNNRGVYRVLLEDLFILFLLVRL